MPEADGLPTTPWLRRWRRNVLAGAASICRASDDYLVAALGPSASGRMDMAESMAGEMSRAIERFGENKVLLAALARLRGLIETQRRTGAAA